MAFLSRQSGEEEYRLNARLQGTAGPINSLAFSRDAKFLASGGDDEMLRIWNVEAKRSHQVISDHLGRWGQITCIKWLSGNSENGNVICFGTGRGLVLVYQRTKDTDTFKELSSTTVLPFNEPVESMDYDRNECRLILSSRTGKVKAYQVEKIGTLMSCWSKDLNNTWEGKGVIPRSVRFTGKGENVIIFGLESGQMMSIVSATGVDSWTKVLKSSIGNVCLSADEKWLLVDNLAKGFDLYQYPRSSPSESFPIPREKAYVQEGIFLENETSIACGSDHGDIYIYSLGTTKCLQKLKHGGGKAAIQVLDACSTSNRHLIASGTNQEQPYIHIWEKEVKGGQKPGRDCNLRLMMVLLFLHIILMLFFAILWTGGQNQFGGWYDVSRQAMQDDVAGGRTADKSGSQIPVVVAHTPGKAGSQIPAVTHTPVSNSLSNSLSLLK